MENYFKKFRDNIIGIDQDIDTPYGKGKRVIYADWTASGRNYLPIEKIFQKDILPFVANTHTETNSTGKGMTLAYHKAQSIIKKHVNADNNDILISCDSGMTGVVNKLQRILGLRIHEKYKNLINLPENERPIVFITHMEHHSNQTSWLETIADVRVIEPDSEGLVNLDHFKRLLEEFKERKLKIAAVTSCSNVTGIFTPYHDITKLIHEQGGYCFVDFACSAPYVNINMHPEDQNAYLDAIYFSPHKFLGGPGSSGIVIFNKKLYSNNIPDAPGGGTVDWTNPWGQHKYLDNIEAREDGGTPSFLQTMRVALCIKLKEEMGVDNILKREKEQVQLLWDKLSKIKNLHLLAANIKERLGIFSFYIDGLYYNLGVKMLNDKFGIQTRGGCSCAGTYGHYLLNVDEDQSKQITNQINSGDYSLKPGWIRLSIHPTMTDEELTFIADSIESLATHHQEWEQDYHISRSNNLLEHKSKETDLFIERHIDSVFSKKLY